MYAARLPWSREGVYGSIFPMMLFFLPFSFYIWLIFLLFLPNLPCKFSSLWTSVHLPQYTGLPLFNVLKLVVLVLHLKFGITQDKFQTEDFLVEFQIYRSQSSVMHRSLEMHEPRS